MNTHATFAVRVNAYLDYRRRAGFALKIEGWQLEHFARFADHLGHQGPLTVKLAQQWASATKRPNALTAGRRIEALRPFARYCAQFDPATEIPTRGLFGPTHRRLTPHIYTDAEICALLEACAHLHPPGGLRGTCCATLFGLIASTGLRTSEAVGLQRPDVDLEHGILHIRHTKFGKSRWVPLHSSTIKALWNYVHERDREPLAATTEDFFVFDYGRPTTTRSLEYAFRLLRQRLQWRSRGGHPVPRIYDLRHTFACHNLERWYAQGLDIDGHILALSTYLGHAKITDTYWYLTATPDLLAKAAERVEQRQGGGL